jgi:hypothetical protein
MINPDTIEEIITRQQMERAVKRAREHNIELDTSDFDIHADGTVTIDGMAPHDWLDDMIGEEN